MATPNNLTRSMLTATFYALIESLVHQPDPDIREELAGSFIEDVLDSLDDRDDMQTEFYNMSKYRPVMFTDVDTGINQMWFTCKGNRETTLFECTSLPYLLVLDCLNGWYQPKKGRAGENDDTLSIEHFITVQGTDYQLAAVLY
ncbi:hypothetical protein BG006_003762, partial [Podila minutissima]